MTTPLHVLVLDDSEDDVVLLLRELRRSGFDPTWECHETAGALAAALDREHWDLILSDYHMPSFSAVAVLQLVRDHGADVPVIVVSGDLRDDTIAAALAAGAREYVFKDDLAKLGLAIRRELGRVPHPPIRKRLEPRP